MANSKTVYLTQEGLDELKKETGKKWDPIVIDTLEKTVL